MFEKEAEEYATRECCMTCNNINHFCKEKCECWTFAKKGAEFGYNKVNEWYKAADGAIPKENKLYLVQIKDNGLAIAYFNGRHWETRYNLGESGHCVETVIAWREIPTFEE